MILPSHKTKIVATIGPACSSPPVLEAMIRAGMNIARLNFSHGDFAAHAQYIGALRAAARAVGKPVAIMADLCGPKMRVGDLAVEKIQLKAGAPFTLTTEEIKGGQERVSVSFPLLPKVVKRGDMLSLNDGYIQLEVQEARGSEVVCVVKVGGELRSRKGLNLPGIDLGISAFTERDRQCLQFAMEHGVDAVSQSFVESAADLEAVRKAALEISRGVRPSAGAATSANTPARNDPKAPNTIEPAAPGEGRTPFLIAKIERAGALDRLDEILEVADGIMIARGDLGVEVPIERIAVVQKDIMRRANRRGRPVITATQMLESMTTYRLPTRAEATDVSNAILDGTDCVMLSGESATGAFPVEAVAMLARIAGAVEPTRRMIRVKEMFAGVNLTERILPLHLISVGVEASLEYLKPAVIFARTDSGRSARRLCAFRLPVWIAALSPDAAVCQDLLFSYGVVPVHQPNPPQSWNSFTKDWVREHQLPGEFAILTQRPSPNDPESHHRMEIINL